MIDAIMVRIRRQAGSTNHNGDDEESASSLLLRPPVPAAAAGPTDDDDDDDDDQQPFTPLLAATANSDDGDGVSRHRRTLNYIRTDSLEHRHHRVQGGGRRGARAAAGGGAGTITANFLTRAIAAACPQHALPPQEVPQAESPEEPHGSWFSGCQTRRGLRPACCSIAMKWLVPPTYYSSDHCWKQLLSKDCVAGLTVGLMVVPQSMSYARLAGLPVQFGLYSALMPLVAYAVFGTSRQLAVGPVALLSLLLHQGLTALLKDQQQEQFATPQDYQTAYNNLAVQCSLLVGIVYLLLGACRLGFVTIFLSHAVVAGFTTGAALLIALSQVKYLVGYDVAGDRLPELLRSLFAGHHNNNNNSFNPVTFALGTGAIALLVALKRIDVKQHPQYQWLRPAGPLLVTTGALVLTVVLNFWSSAKGVIVPTVGPIPRGVPEVTLHLLWTPIVSDFKPLFWVVIPMVIVGFMESIAIAKQLARKHKYEIDASAELVGLGMANLLGGSFSAFPVTGSFSRSAVNNESGAQSGIAGLVTAALVFVTLLLLTPVFAKLPLFSLAAIVISGVLGLVDFKEAAYLWRVHTFDFAVWLVACLGTLLAGVEAGLAIAVGISLLIVIYESAYPQTNVMGRLPGTRYYRDVQQYPEAEIYDGILVVSIRAPLFFANAQNVREMIRQHRLAAQHSESGSSSSSVNYIILELSAVSHVDTSALHQLESMVDDYRSGGQELVFSNPSLKVMECMANSGLTDKIGEHLFFASLHDAVTWCLHEMDAVSLSTTGQMDSIDDLATSDLTPPVSGNVPTSHLQNGLSRERRRRRPSL